MGAVAAKILPPNVAVPSTPSTEVAVPPDDISPDVNTSELPNESL